MDIIGLDPYNDTNNNTLYNWTTSDSGNSTVFNVTDLYESTIGFVENATDYDYPPVDEIVQRLREIQIMEYYGHEYYSLFLATFIFCILGYVTNVLNVIVLVKTPMSNSMNVFLIVLSVSDIFNISTQFAHIIHYMNGFKLYPYYDWVVFFIANTFFETAFIFISNWLAAIIGIWRCIAITWPLRNRELCSAYRAKAVIILVFVLSFLLSTPILYLYTYQQVDYLDVTFYDREFSSIANQYDRLFLKLFWALQQLKGLIPMIVMVVATVWMIVSLYKIRRKRIKVLQKGMSSAINHRITIMLSVLLVLYWLSNIPDSFMFLIQVSTTDEKLQEEYRRKTDIIRIFTLANSSASFFIYYGLGKDFRKRFHYVLFGWCLKHQRKTSTSDGLSESSTVRSKSFDVGSTRKGSGNTVQNFHLRELNQVVAARDQR